MKKQTFAFAFMLAALLATPGSASAVPTPPPAPPRLRSTRARPADPEPAAPPPKKKTRKTSRGTSPLPAASRASGSAGAGPSNRAATVAANLRRDGAAGSGLRPPGGAIPTVDTFFVPELHPDIGTVRPRFEQPNIVFHPRLPAMTEGIEFFENTTHVNSTSAEVFGLYLEQNADALHEIMNSDFFTVEEKAPRQCPPNCKVHTYPAVLHPVMAALNKKHDNLVKHMTALSPVQRSEVYTPKQLLDFFRAHLTYRVSRADRDTFINELMCRCFTADIYHITCDEQDSVDHLFEHFTASEYPRLRLEFIMHFFPNFRCEGPRSARETIQAFLLVEQVAYYYKRSCLSIFYRRHPDSRNPLTAAPRLTIEDVNDGVDDTGDDPSRVHFVDDASVMTFSRDSPPSACRARRQSIHVLPDVIMTETMNPMSVPSPARVSPAFPHVQNPPVAHGSWHPSPPTHAWPSHAKLSPVTSTHAYYSREDVAADLDLIIKPVAPLVTTEHAIEYLGADMPIRSHSIWKILHAWNTTNVHLLNGRNPDFSTWYRRFALQANHHRLPASVAWWMANCLLPDKHQEAILSHVCERDFVGFNRASWCQFVTRLTGGKDATLLAIEQLHALAPNPLESLSQFLLRFQELALRASTPTSLLETGLLAENEFKLLHSTMVAHAYKFGTWVKTEWYHKYNTQATSLRSMCISSMSTVQKELAIRDSIKVLISDMRSLDAMKQDEPRPIPVFNASVTPKLANQKHNSARRANVLPKPPGYGGPTVYPPYNPSLPGRMQRFNIKSHTYEQAVETLNCSKAEMDFRFANRMCATCVGRVPLACSPSGTNGRKIHCENYNSWRTCEGLVRFPEKRDEYIEKVARLFENTPRPTRRVSSCAHVLASESISEFPTLSVPHSAACIQLITSEPVHPDIPTDHVRSHMHTVHGESAFNDLHCSAMNKHTCVEVLPEDIRVCLSQLA